MSATLQPANAAAAANGQQPAKALPKGICSPTDNMFSPVSQKLRRKASATAMAKSRHLFESSKENGGSAADAPMAE